MIEHFPLFRFFSDCWIEKHEKLADYNYFLYFCRKIEKYGRTGYDLCDDYGRCRCYSTLASYKMGQEILGESLMDKNAAVSLCFKTTFTS